MAKKSLDGLTESMFYVLMAFLRGPKFGIEVIEFIDVKTHGRVVIGPGTLYTILSKFEEELLISEIEVKGRRRTYQITDKGRAIFELEINRLKICVDDGESEV